MHKYQEDMIPVDFILMLADGLGNKMSEIALLALIETWMKYGKKYSEAVEEDIYYE